MPYHKWEEYRSEIEFLDKEPKTKEEALKITRNSHRFTVGVFHKETREIYHKSLYGSLNPVEESLSREKRVEKINEILKP